MILDQTSKALYTTLTGGTALTTLLAGTASVYDTQAPDNATLPYIVFSLFGGGPENLDPNLREDNLWYIRAYSSTSSKTASEIFEQADALLHKINLSILGASTIWTVRRENIAGLENTNSGKIWNSGGVYEIRTSEYTGYDWYVDSVNGSDSNDGQTADEAFATLTKLMTVLTAADSVGLAKGSRWREQLTISVNNVSLFAYGSGARPIIDGSNVMSGWSKTAGRTSVYQISCTPEWGSNNNYLNVWEDGSFLTRAADLAGCDGTAGTYYPSAATGTITLYVHATGDGDPATNGKTYEYSHRARSIYAANTGITGLSIDGIHTRCNLEENGSIFIYKQSTVRDCLIADGSRHNLYIGEGSALYDTTLRNAYYGAGSYSLLVCYSATGTGLGFTCDNCACENTKGGVDALGTGFYGHTTAGSLGPIVYSNIEASNLGYGLDTGLSASSVTITTFDASNCLYGIIAGVNTTLSGYTHSIDTNRRSITVSAGVTLIISNSTTTLTGTYPSSGHIYSAGAGVTVRATGCTFIDNNSQSIIYIGATGATVYCRTCTFQAVTRPFNITATGSVDSDYNRFTDDVAPILNGVTYNTLALWQAGTGNDLNSTIG